MKYLSSFLAAMLLSILIFSQGRTQPQQEDSQALKWNNADMNNKASKANSRWFNVVDALNHLNLVSTSWSYTIHPDTTTFLYRSSSLQPVEIIATGQVFDPTSSVWRFGQEIYAISDQANYTLDSIAIPYSYFRPQNGNPDTLIIQIYSSSAMTYVDKFVSIFSQAYCFAQYDAVAFKGLNPIKEFEVLLDSSEVTGTGIWKSIDVFVDLPVTAGEEVAMSFQFNPGNASNPGDTLFNSNSITTAEPGNINAFMFRGVNYSSNAFPDYYNFSMDVLTEYGKGLYANSWSFDFCPGVYGNYQNDISFKISSDEISGVQNRQTTNSFRISPNPSQGLFHINGLERVTEYQVFDQFGRSISTGILSQQNNALDLREIPKGLYYLKIGAQTKTLIKE